jgi:hypothetical protein
MTLLPKVDTQKEHIFSQWCLFTKHFGDDCILDDWFPIKQTNAQAWVNFVNLDDYVNNL